MAYKYIIVEDNELDRLFLKALMKHFEDFLLIGEFADAEIALPSIREYMPEILFLDIDMGKMSGLELRERLQEVPICIFITSHPEYAVESFEMNALDFIVKPLKKDRLEKTIFRIKEYLQIRNKAYLLDKEMGSDVIYIKEGNDKIKINSHEIIYLEAYKDYTKIVTENKFHVILCTLGNLLNQTPFSQFIRIHRSYAIAKHKIRKITGNEVYMDNIALPIGRSYKEILQW